MAVTASEARKNLFPLIEQVNDDRTPIEITSRRGDAVLLSRADYDALEETAHLLRVPANAKRLIESLQQAVAGQRVAEDDVGDVALESGIVEGLFVAFCSDHSCIGCLRTRATSATSSVARKIRSWVRHTAASATVRSSSDPAIG